MFTWLFVLRIRPNSFYLNIFRFFDRKMSWNSIFLKLSLLFTVNIGIYKSISPCLKTKLFLCMVFCYRVSSNSIVNISAKENNKIDKQRGSNTEELPYIANLVARGGQTKTNLWSKVKKQRSC